MNVKNRLLAFIEYIKVDKSVFERNCGLSNGFVDKSGDNIRNSSLSKISAAYPMLNINWLLTGNGEMLNKSDSGNINVGVTNSGVSYGIVAGGSNNVISNNLNSEIEAYKRNIESLEEKVRMLEDKIKTLEKLITEKEATIKAKDEIIELLKKRE